jgi:hypothetical protein
MRLSKDDTTSEKKRKKEDQDRDKSVVREDEEIWRMRMRRIL